MKRFSPFFFVVSKIISKFAASLVGSLWVKRAVLFYEKDVF